MSEEDDKSSSLDELRKSFENSHLTFDEDPSEWLGLVRDKLFSMFCSPMKEDYSHEAFRWVSQLCLSIGDFSWMTTGNKWTPNEAKVFSCVARLSLGEVQILLPLIQRHLTSGAEPEMEDESIIKSLVKDQDDDDDNDDETSGQNPVTDAIKDSELENLLGRLKETMDSVCDYLELVNRHWQDIIASPESEKFSSAQGALRIIFVWLSEDPGGFEAQCKRFLIDLMVKNLLLDSKSVKHDLTILALHSVCAESDVLAESLSKIPEHKEALEIYLRYVEREQRKSTDRRTQKTFKLRCGLVKDLANKVKR